MGKKGIAHRRFKDAEPLIAHCAAGFNNVVVTGRGDLFVHPRRPLFYGD